MYENRCFASSWEQDIFCMIEEKGHCTSFNEMSFLCNKIEGFSNWCRFRMIQWYNKLNEKSMF
ncbi:hypothetical protein CHH83_19785 [Bacillus sp. 7586-K]|nr:hypothetical protein CHH83_19785 [Bacillus sp. 7586-K]